MTVGQSWLDSNPPRPYQFFAQPNYNGTFILSPDGRHLYATTRGADTIAGFEVGPDGALSPAKFVSVPSNGRVRVQAVWCMVYGAWRMVYGRPRAAQDHSHKFKPLQPHTRSQLQPTSP